MSLQPVSSHSCTAVRSDQGVYALFKDGHPAYCPKHPPMPVGQNSINDAYQFGRVHCDTGCPFAQVVSKEQFKDTETGGSVKDGMQDMYIISCEGGSLEIPLTTVDNPPQNKTILQAK